MYATALENNALNMKQKLVKIAMPLLEVIQKQWFLIGILVVILGAYFDPDIGMKGGKKV